MKAVIFLSGIAGVIFFGTVGAILSRKYRFEFGWLAIPSLIMYSCIGYFASRYINTNAATLQVCCIALIDLTLGLALAIKFGAYGRLQQEQWSFRSHWPHYIQGFILMMLAGMGGVWLAGGFN